jgi:asparagine synthetase B (glutamine-hydrolysing)
LDSPERQYAEYVANKFSIDLKIVYPESIETEKYLMDYSQQCGEPSMSALIPYVTAKETAKFGNEAISANGADELFFGYDSTHDLVCAKQRDHIFRGSAFSNFSMYPYSDNWPGGQIMTNGRFCELSTYVQFDLNKTLDFASMCHGLEVRSPFLDHRLVEKALSIPESVHRKNGNKSILKSLLARMGFDSKFINRPKEGFCLHRQPERMDELITKAWNWVHENGFLKVNHLTLSPRDRKYLEMSTLGFYYWFKCWETKIK